MSKVKKYIVLDEVNNAVTQPGSISQIEKEIIQDGYEDDIIDGFTIHEILPGKFFHINKKLVIE